MPLTRLQMRTALALLALLPVGLYLVDQSAPIISLSLVSVVIIAASLYVMFGPAEKVSTNQTH
jgi:hypothetical protein